MLTHDKGGRGTLEGLDQERRAVLDLLRMASMVVTPEEIARRLLVLVQAYSGCEAVALRLKQGCDFPYVAFWGFPPGFLAQENHLCTMDVRGRMHRDSKRRPVLECVCGHVLSEPGELAHAYFTEHGSFVTNSISDLVAGSAEPILPWPTRNSCQIAGYESIGLFPIRRNDVTYGLIQCNDHRRDRFPPEQVTLLEDLSDSSAHLFEQAMV